MINAAFILAFHSFLRCGQLTSSMKWEDIKVDMARHCLEVWLQRSKTDPSGCVRLVFPLLSTCAYRPIYAYGWRIHLWRVHLPHSAKRFLSHSVVVSAGSVFISAGVISSPPLHPASKHHLKIIWPAVNEYKP